MKEVVVNDRLIRLLLVEDNPGDARLLQETLADIQSAQFDLVVVSRLSEALTVLEQEARFDVMLLDLSLPDSHGLQTFLKVHERARSTPIILLTGLDDAAFAAEAARRGAQDYLVKGQVDGNLLMRTIRYAIERKRAEEALRQRNRQLALLNRTGQMLSSTLDLDQVFVTFLEEVRALLAVARCSIWLVDSHEDLLCVQATGPQRERLVGQRSPQGEGSVGWVVRTGESLIVRDTLAEQPGLPFALSSGQDVQRSILAVPLRVNDKVVGALQVTDPDANRLTPTDLALMNPLAAFAAIAIENARLYRRLLQHAEQLEERVHKRTNQLQAQYGQLEAILRNTADGIIVADKDGNIERANPVVQSWLEHGLTQEDAHRLQAAVRELTLRAAERPVETLELEDLDLELTAAPITGPGSGDGAAVVAVHDVSHLKALDRLKSQFVSNVSHELRTPITAIKLYAVLMRRRPEKYQEYLHTLEQEADREAQLVENILEISRIDAGRLCLERHPSCLDELLAGAVSSHRPLAASRGVTLEQVFGRPPMAWVDPESTNRVLNNLLENAINFTLPGGKVTVSTGQDETPDGSWVTARVTDTGIGIPKDEVPHIFERFFRGQTSQKRQIPGTGLGLAIVKEIIELHGGDIDVASCPDEGTTFTVRFPQADESNAQEEQVPQVTIVPKAVETVQMGLGQEPTLGNLVPAR
jgi:signal transduction histidine kinase/DNA-binding response OmpR family regulator